MAIKAVACTYLPMIPITVGLRDFIEKGNPQTSVELRFFDSVGSGMAAGITHSHLLVGVNVFRVAKTHQLPHQTTSEALRAFTKQHGPILRHHFPDFRAKMCMRGGAVGISLFLTEQAYKKYFDKSDSDDSGTSVKSSRSS